MKHRDPRQLTLKLASPEEMASSFDDYMAPLKLPPRQLAVLRLLRLNGESKVRNEQHFSELQMSLSRAARRAGVAKATFKRGAEELEERKLVAILRHSTPWTYVAAWSRVAKLKPPDELDPLDGHEILSSDWDDPGQGRSPPGHGARDTVSNRVFKPRVSVNRVRDSVHGPASARMPPGDEPEPDGEPPDWWPRPWDRESGLDDEGLVRAVSGGWLGALRRLYDEALRLGWIADSEDARLRFLSLCHHAATTVGIHRRMAVLVAAVKRDLDVSKVRHASEDWAAAALKKSRRAAEFAERVCV